MLKKLIAFAKSKNASDLHIAAGNYPFLRILGDMLPIKEAGILDNKTTSEMLIPILSSENLEIFKEKKQLDFGYKFDNTTRYRVNLYQTESGLAAAFREIPNEIPTLESIYAPDVVRKLSEMNNGLILICGPTGSGKSTTLAAMINHINTHSRSHIITIEDPLEFSHSSKLSLVNHREVGISASSFSLSLKSALREDPDVIMVGELRDLETIQLALTAAETGHLVLATLHTGSSSQSIERIIDVFNEDNKGMISTMLANSLKGVISQNLVKAKGNKKRLAVFEVMMVNTSVSNLIKSNKVGQINSMMQIGSKYGMITMKDSARKLVEQGLVEQEAVNYILNSPVEIDEKILKNNKK